MMLSRSVSMERGTSQRRSRSQSASPITNTRRSKSRSIRQSKHLHNDLEMLELHSFTQTTSRLCKKHENQTYRAWANSGRAANFNSLHYARKKIALLEHKKLLEEEERKKNERRKLQQEKLARKRREKLAALGRLRMELEWKALQRKMMTKGNKGTYFNPNCNKSTSATWYENASQLDYCWPNGPVNNLHRSTIANNVGSNEKTRTQKSVSRSLSSSACRSEQPSRLAIRLSESKRMDEWFCTDRARANNVHECKSEGDVNVNVNVNETERISASYDKLSMLADTRANTEKKKVLPSSFKTPNTKLFQDNSLQSSLPSFLEHGTSYRELALTESLTTSKGDVTDERTIFAESDVNTRDANNWSSNSVYESGLPLCLQKSPQIKLREIDCNCIRSLSSAKKSNNRTSELDLSPIPLTRTADNSCLITENEFLTRRVPMRETSLLKQIEEMHELDITTHL